MQQNNSFLSKLKTIVINTHKFLQKDGVVTSTFILSSLVSLWDTRRYSGVWLFYPSTTIIFSGVLGFIFERYAPISWRSYACYFCVLDAVEDVIFHKNESLANLIPREPSSAIDV